MGIFGIYHLAINGLVMGGSRSPLGHARLR